MDYRLEVHPEAAFDGQAAYRWYKERNPQAAQAFNGELDLAEKRILASPLTWPPHLHGTRRYLMRGFPYGVVYQVMDDRIFIIAIAHTSRRPGYWQELI